MTDQDRSTQPAEPETSEQPIPTAPEASAPAPVAPRKGGTSPLVAAVAVLVVLAVVLGVALWYQNQQYQTLHADMVQQGGQAAREAQQAREAADQARAEVSSQSAQLQQLQQTLDELRSQADDLDRALQMMTDSGSDLLLLNDIDRLVSIAQQQLQLEGNVANAIISLEVAQARLARANRPALAALQQTINGDVDRLRAVVTIDLPTLSAQLDRLYLLLGEAPLLVPDTAATQSTPQAAAPPPPVSDAQAIDPDAPWWRRAGAEAWDWTRDAGTMLSHDLRSLFEVRRIDDAAALLISPEQAMRFRENLQQRTLTAQLALMMHQSKIWQTELGHIADAVDRRFDMRSGQSREALGIARALLDTAIETRLPTVDNSLEAIAAVRDTLNAQDASESQSSDPESPASPANPDAAGPTEAADPGALAAGAQ